LAGANVREKTGQRSRVNIWNDETDVFVEEAAVLQKDLAEVTAQSGQEQPTSLDDSTVHAAEDVDVAELFRVPGLADQAPLFLFQPPGGSNRYARPLRLQVLFAGDFNPIRIPPRRPRMIFYPVCVSRPADRIGNSNSRRLTVRLQVKNLINFRMGL
jgi:hypothetical protein